MDGGVLDIVASFHHQPTATDCHCHSVSTLMAMTALVHSGSCAVFGSYMLVAIGTTMAGLTMECLNRFDTDGAPPENVPGFSNNGDPLMLGLSFSDLASRVLLVKGTGTRCLT